MSLKEVTYAIEDLQLEAKQLEGIQNAIYTSFFFGGLKEEQMEYAFGMLVGLTIEFNEKLKIAMDNLFEVMQRTEKQEVEPWNKHRNQK